MKLITVLFLISFSVFAGNKPKYGIYIGSQVFRCESKDYDVWTKSFYLENCEVPIFGQKKKKIYNASNFFELDD